MGTLWWLLESLFLYIFIGIVVIPVVHQLTKNSWIKLPIFLVLSIPITALMVWMHYIPFLLFIALVGTNHFLLQNIQKQDFIEKVGYVPNKLIFSISSYAFLLITFLLTQYLQLLKPMGDKLVPVWKTFFM